MKAARLHGPGEMRLDEVADPLPGAGEALVAVEAVGICASDLHTYHARPSTSPQYPLILGHEAAGRVVSLPKGEWRVQVGDLVAIDPSRPCGSCKVCRQGRFNICPTIRFFGREDTDGALCELIACSPSSLYRVAPTVTPLEAALAENFCVGDYTMELANWQPGQTLCIVGAGAIGLSVLQSARLRGKRTIVVTDYRADRLEMAAMLGATQTIQVGVDGGLEAVAAATEGLGADVVCEAGGTAEAAQHAVDLAAPGGRVLVVGISPLGRFDIVSLIARRKQLRLTFVRRYLGNFPRAIHLLQERRIDLACYVTHRFSLDDAPEAFRLVDSAPAGLIKAIVHLGQVP